ncbi:DUF4349 domain-containing protein [Geosporobacter ferrireducens]|uniref:Uncharacterized protein n=1 Tax=Geosporobacter ferrireducens TaxID=1424294 RepID=A0A1D8GPD0_9FIRM|nr:DUF4349 domain-containing protein [Geosporobacter ferrireducens]AOT72727.1 hypothetical protein Gferi_26115 [Geosporobacter ferrireducens]MTI55137.1 DUF4349 domain-containing protein [Geosporobacter ferrireducens]
MNCTDLNELMSLYIDNMLDEHTNEIINKHIQECSACKSAYQELKSILDQCRQLPMTELPEDFETSLHEKLVAASTEVRDGKEEILNLTDVRSKKRKINWKVLTSIAAVFIVFIVSVSVINQPMKSRQSKGMPTENTAEQPQMFQTGSAPMSPQIAQDSARRGDLNGAEFSIEEYGTSSTENEQMDVAMKEKQNLIKSAQQDGRKVIKNANIHIDVVNYDEKFNQIMNTAIAYGGYIENSNTQYKYYNVNNPEESLKVGDMLIRVPENQMENILEQIKTLGSVTNYGINGSDITLQYRDTANEVENLKIQEARLREIMGKANTVKDILEVERELSRIRGEINRLTGEIKRWDDLVSLSTVQVSLNEISPKDQRIQPPSEHVWDKAKKGFIKTINQIVEVGERLLIGFVSILPIVLLAGLVIAPSAWFIAKALKKKKN